MFAIDEVSGDISTLLPLDREEIGFYNFTLIVQDGGSPPQSAQVSVLITIGDVNDNTPVFTGGAVLTSVPIAILEV